MTPRVAATCAWGGSRIKGLTSTEGALRSKNESMKRGEGEGKPYPKTKYALKK